MPGPWEDFQATTGVSSDNPPPAKEQAKPEEGPWSDFQSREAPKEKKEASRQGSGQGEQGERGEPPTHPPVEKSAEAPSTFASNVEGFKSGMAGFFATPAIATDIMQVGLDQAAHVANVATKVAQGVMPSLIPKDAAEAEKQKWQFGNKPEEENLGGYKMAKRGVEELLRSDRLLTGGQHGDVTYVEPVPKDSFGGESRSAETQRRIFEYIGADVFPGAGAVAGNGQKLLATVTQLAGDSLAGLSSTELKHQLGNWAPKFGFTREQGEAIGDQLGGFLGPKGATMVGGKIAEASAAANRVAAPAVAAKGWKAYLPWTEEGKKAQTEAAHVDVNKEILRAYNSNPTNAENVREISVLRKRMDNFKPGIASETNDPYLKSVQKQVSQGSQEGFIEAQKLAKSNAEAIAKFKGEKFPGSTVGVTEGARADIATKQGMVAQQLNNTQRELTAMGDKFSRSVDKTKVGEDLREMYFSKKEAAKKVLDSQIDDVYQEAEQAGIKIGMVSIRDAVKTVVGSDKETFQDMPGSFKKILSEYDTPPPKVSAPVKSAGSTINIRRAAPVMTQEAPPTASFKEFHSLYKELNRDWNNLAVAGTIGGNLDKARKVQIIRDAMKKQLDSYSGPEYGSFANKFNAFNQNYTKYSETFKQGAGGALGKRTPNGYSTDAENIVDKVFLKTGDKAKGIDDFFQVYGSDERAAKLLNDGIVDNFSRSAVNAQGEWDQKGAERWLKNNSRAMDQLPALKQELTAQKDIGDSLLARKNELYAERKTLDRTVMAQVAKGQDPKLLIQAGMKDPKFFNALLAASKTPENKQSLARAVVDTVLDGQKDPYKFLMENEKSLKPVMQALGPKHWSNLQIIAKAQEVSERVPAPTSVNVPKVTDAAEALTGTSGRSLFNIQRSIAAGRGSKPDAIVSVGGKWYYKVRNDQADALRQKAIFDPDLAQSLAKVMGKDGVKDGPITHKEMMDLKKMAFANGIMIGSHQVQSQATLQERQKRGEAHRDYDEGRDKWRRSTSSPLY